MGLTDIAGRASVPAGDEAGRRRSTVPLLAVALAIALVVPAGVAGVAVAVDAPDDRVANAATLQTGPTASLSVTPNPAHPGEQVTFDATESTAGGDDSIEQCEFDTDGDGTYETATQTCQVVRSYDTTAEYTVSVRVVTTAGETANDTETLVVRTNEVPIAAISVSPGTPRADVPVTLSAADSTDPDGEIVRYRWTVDGLTVANSSEASVERTFGSTGEYEIGLTVVDDDGAQHSTATSIQVVENRPPTAALTVSSAEPVVGEAIELDASGSTDPEGAIVAYRWDLDGDGTTERETETPETSVTFDDAGERSVRVVVVDDFEATDGATVEFAVGSADDGGAVGTADTPVTAEVPGNESGDRGSGLGPLGSLDYGIVPLVPDVLVLLALLGVIGTATLIVRRRDTVESRIEDLRERVRRGDVRQKAGKSATSTVLKTAFKKVVRRLADGVEASGDALGGVFEWIGRTIRRVTDWVADALRRIGG